MLLVNMLPGAHKRFLYVAVEHSALACHFNSRYQRVINILVRGRKGMQLIGGGSLWSAYKKGPHLMGHN
jgi:hypothetical protein